MKICITRLERHDRQRHDAGLLMMMMYHMTEVKLPPNSLKVLWVFFYCLNLFNQ